MYVMPKQPQSEPNYMQISNRYNKETRNNSLNIRNMLRFHIYQYHKQDFKQKVFKLDKAMQWVITLTYHKCRSLKL